MFSPRTDEDTRMFVLRMTARVSSVVVFLILFLFYSDGSLALDNIGPRETVGFLMFPVGLLAGFALGWHNELWGGLLSMCSTVGFYLIYGLLLYGSVDQGWAFLVFTLPGLLFLIYGIVHSRTHHFDGRRAIV